MNDVPVIETRDLTIRFGGNVAVNRTTLLVEHKFDMIMTVSDSIAVLKEGQLVCDDTPEAVSNNEEVQAAYLGGGVKHG